MSLKYHVIEIFTSEEGRWEGQPLYEAIVRFVSRQKIAARCVVSRGIAGCYESGEIATQRILTLAMNMPLKIEIILPAPELDRVLPTIEQMVTDGIVVVEEMQIRSHRTQRRLIPRHLKVRDAMTTDPRSVRPETPIAEVVHLLLRSPFKGVPVVDPEGQVVGIVTQGDLVSQGLIPLRPGLLAQLDQERLEAHLDQLDRRGVGEVMTRDPVTISQEAYLTQAVDRMLQRGLKRLPVVDDRGRLVGMLSRFDVFQVVTRQRPDWETLEREYVQIQGARMVRDIMRRDIDTVTPETSIREVIERIGATELQRVAVVDSEGHLLGIITDRDLLAAFSEHPLGVWEYLVSKLPFTELGRRYRTFAEKVHATTAGEVMITDVVTVREETPLDEAIQIMVEKEIKRLPVVDESGRFRGMIRREDILRASEDSEA